MERDDFPGQRKSQPHAAVCSATRFVDAKEGLKDAYLVLLGNARPLVAHAQQYTVAFGEGADLHGRVGRAVANGVFGQVEQQSIDERVAADRLRVAFACKRNTLLFGKGRQVGDNFFDHRRQLDCVVAGNIAQLAHLEQRLCHARHSLGLLLQQTEQARCVGIGVGVLGAKQLNLGLHECEGRAQLVCRVARKLSLRRKSLVKTGNHVVKRRTAAPKLKGRVLADFCVGKVVGSYALDLRRKGVQRPQRMPV